MPCEPGSPVNPYGAFELDLKKRAALDALHDAGWVHGDVKPENAIVGTSGHVTLIDLGFASRIHTLAGHHYRGQGDNSVYTRRLNTDLLT